MADLLIELVGEEIPARMQTMAAQHLPPPHKPRLMIWGCGQMRPASMACVDRDIWPFTHAALQYLSLIV